VSVLVLFLLSGLVPSSKLVLVLVWELVLVPQLMFEYVFLLLLFP